MVPVGIDFQVKMVGKTSDSSSLRHSLPEVAEVQDYVASWIASLQQNKRHFFSPNTTASSPRSPVLRLKDRACVAVNGVGKLSHNPLYATAFFLRCQATIA